MNTASIAIIVFLIALLVDTSANGEVAPRARATVRVTDEQGRRVQGAEVTFTFFNPRTRQGVPVMGLTDSNGEFSGEGFSDPKIGGQIQMNGYYPSGFPFEPFRDIEDNRWLPWNPLYETTLRKIGEPVALCAKIVQSDVPLLDQECGYDLEKGDWVVPHGKGVTADLIFKVAKDYTDRFNFKVKASVTFSHPADGLVRMAAPAYARYSHFRWERFAPETGYEALHAISYINYDPNSGKMPERTFRTQNDRLEGYFLRVRTIEKNGRIVSANYGKIVGDIRIDPRETKTCLVTFTYTFNPTANDRNQEWNTQKNLLEGLRRNETPQWP